MRVTRTIKLIGACGLIAGLLMVLSGAGMAGAATPSVTLISASGQTGTVGIPTTVCTTVVFPQYDPYGIGAEGRSLTIRENAPTVYTRNITSGVDSQYVISRPILVDQTAGLSWYGPWGKWMLATDGSPAQAPSFTFSAENVSGWNIHDVYATRFEVWWSNGGSSYGKLVMQQNQYVQSVNFYGSVTNQTAKTCRMP